jgi:hypothetical protein
MAYFLQFRNLVEAIGHIRSYLYFYHQGRLRSSLEYRSAIDYPFR